MRVRIAYDDGSSKERDAWTPRLQKEESREPCVISAPDHRGLTGAGAMMWDDQTTEMPQLNDVEVWEIFNSTEDAHPIHLHLVSFQVLSRQKFNADQDFEAGALGDIRLLGQPKPPADNEAGWKDT
jgi:FtsP/CotA-like multicopper oxidase with cupredoxin domain